MVAAFAFELGLATTLSNPATFGSRGRILALPGSIQKNAGLLHSFAIERLRARALHRSKSKVVLSSPKSTIYGMVTRTPSQLLAAYTICHKVILPMCPGQLFFSHSRQ